MAERLQKFIARAGVASRRKAEELIAAGRVTVNGHIVKQPGISVQETDQVMVDGRPLKPAQHLVYYALNKPKGVITTSSDEQGRRTVLDLVPNRPRVVACGRLDAATTGLILLTNDGDLCYRLTHPKYEHEKEYAVVATINKGPSIEERLRRLEQGVKLEEGMTSPAKIKHVRRQEMRIHFTIVLHEGKNRQVRRMCSAVGLDVVELTRTRIGKIELGDLPTGKWRLLKKEDVI